MTFIDKNGTEVVTGSIIDIHQTVNGQHKFVVASLSPLDIRYDFDRSYVYQYDMEELLTPSRFTGEVDFEVIGICSPSNIPAPASRIKDFEVEEADVILEELIEFDLKSLNLDQLRRMRDIIQEFS